MRSVLNPINIIPTIVRQPIPVLLEADIINSPLTIYFSARSPLRSARTHTYTLRCPCSELSFLHPRPAPRYFHTPRHHLARS